MTGDTWAVRIPNPVGTVERLRTLTLLPGEQVAVGTAKVLLAAGLLGLPAERTAAVIALLTVAIYGHNDLTDLAEDGVNDPARTAVVAGRRRALACAAGVAAVLALLVAATGGPRAVLLALVPAAIGICYNAAVLPGPGPGRLKEILVLNTAATALAWAVPVALLPVAFAGAMVGPAVLGVAAYLFGRTYVASEFANVADASGDATAGVSTLPVVLGPRRTRWLLLVADILTGVLVSVTAAVGVLPLRAAVALVAGVCVSGVAVQPLVDVAPAERRPTLRDLEFVVAAALLIA